MNANQLPEPPRDDSTADNTNGPALFDLGRIVATPGALALLEKLGVDPFSLLRRHVRGDWADMDPSDWTANANAVKDGGRVFSSYLVNKHKVWVITEAVNDSGLRSSSCILLPSEY
jgi:hypothetical protein